MKDPSSSMSQRKGWQKNKRSAIDWELEKGKPPPVKCVTLAHLHTHSQARRARDEQTSISIENRGETHRGTHTHAHTLHTVILSPRVRPKELWGTVRREREVAGEVI